VASVNDNQTNEGTAMLKFSDIKVGQTLKSGTVRMTVVSVTEKKAKAIQVFNGKCIEITILARWLGNPQLRPLEIA
jgi:ribosomal protein L19